MTTLVPSVVHATPHYIVTAADRTTRIIYEDRITGKIGAIKKPKYVLSVRCLRSGAVVEFSRYRNMRRWYWRDSRDQKYCQEREVRAELSRMLADPAVASALIATHMIAPAC